MNKERWVIAILATVILSLLFFTGVVVHPLKAVRRLTRQTIHPCLVDAACHYEIPVEPPRWDWSVLRPNVSLYCMSMGGFGNSIVSLATAFEACLHYGLRPPVLSVEVGGDFDFHKLSSPHFNFPAHPKSITEFYPWVHTTVSKTFLGIWAILNKPTMWKGDSLESFPAAGNVILSVDYGRVMKLSTRAFEMVRNSINPNIYRYIRENYDIKPRTMAVHLRLGQPTDDFIPPSPSAQHIVDFQALHRPDRVLLFTDNPGEALKVMQDTGLEYATVSDVNYIECLLISMCEYAIISESTFAVSACRLGNVKKVSLPSSQNSGFKQDEEWTTF